MEVQAHVRVVGKSCYCCNSTLALHRAVGETVPNTMSLRGGTMSLRGGTMLLRGGTMSLRGGADTLPVVSCAGLSACTLYAQIVWCMVAHEWLLLVTVPSCPQCLVFMTDNIHSMLLNQTPGIEASSHCVQVW